MAEWQKGTGWKEWFEITGADGVDFHPIGQDPLNFLENHIDLWVDWPFEINDCEIDDIGELSQVYFTDQTN